MTCGTRRTISLSISSIRRSPGPHRAESSRAEGLPPSRDRGTGAQNHRERPITRHASDQSPGDPRQKRPTVTGQGVAR